MVREGKGRPGRVRPHWISDRIVITTNSVRSDEGVINHNGLPSLRILGTELMLKDITDNTDRKTVSRSCEIDREEGNLPSSRYNVLESPLRECSILRDGLKDPEKEIMKGAKSRLRPIVEDGDHPSLALQIRNPHKSPHRATREFKTPSIEPLEERELPHDPLHLTTKGISPNHTNLVDQSLRKGDEVAERGE